MTIFLPSLPSPTLLHLRMHSQGEALHLFLHRLRNWGPTLAYDHLHTWLAPGSQPCQIAPGQTRLWGWPWAPCLAKAKVKSWYFPCRKPHILTVVSVRFSKVCLLFMLYWILSNFFCSMMNHSPHDAVAKTPPMCPSWEATASTSI